MVSLRGTVWWAEPGRALGSAPGQRRPVVVVSDDGFNTSKLQTVIVVGLTGNQRLAGMPGNVAVPAELSGLPHDSVVNVTQIATIGRRALEEPAGALPQWVVAQIDTGLRRVLGLDQPGAL